MKLHQASLSAIVFLGLLSSCDLFTDDEVTVQKSPVLSITTAGRVSNKVVFLTKASWPNGCGKFHSFAFSKADSIFNIDVFGMQPKEGACTTAFIEFDATVEIRIDTAGTYTFKFWNTDTSSVDTTFSI